MEKKIIDLEEVMERVQDDKELLLELFEIFSEDYELKIRKLKPAIAEKNFEAVQDLIHSIKGAAGNISAKSLHAACVNIEQLASTRNIDAVEMAVSALDGHYKNLQRRMAEIKKQFGA